jgi:pimeloyl-ACP methyl ester carboxylesterase
VLARPEVARVVHAAAVESFRQGARGAALELLLFLARPWGFQPEELAVPVHLWYGTEDVTVPIGMGRALARAIPGSHLVELRDAGHLAFLEHWEPIMRTAAAG